MPFKSDAQRAFFNANRKKLESQGVDVDEWNASSRGKKLPARVAKAASAPPYPSAVSAAGAGASAGQLTGHLGGKQANFLAISDSPFSVAMAKLEQSKKVANYMEVPGMISTIAQLAKASAEKTAFSSGLGMLPKPPMPTSSRPTAGPGGSGGVGGIISGMLPKPTMPYAAGGPGGMASTGAGATQPKLNLQQAGQEVNQAMRNTIRSGRPGPSATAMQMAPQTPQPKPAAPAMNPSDQAKAMLADLNARRRAAGGEVSDAADIQSKANALLNQSNAMRNAAGYKPAAGGNLRDQADAIRQKLNAMRSAAGGEVPESAAMMREMNRLNAQYDSTSFPSSVSTQMLAKAAAEKTALAGLTGGSLGALTGLLTSEKGQRNRAVGRGAAIGAGTEIGIYPGALAGALAGGGLGLAHSPAAALGGLVAGGGLGAVGGGALGNMAARGLVGPYKNEKLDSGEGDEDEEAEEKEAACSKKTRYQKMRERRGEIDNLAADAAMVTRGEKSAFSFSGLFGSKPAAPKPAAPKPVAPAAAPAPNAAKPNSLKAMGKEMGVYSANKSAGILDTANNTLEDLAQVGERQIHGMIGNNVGRHLAQHVVPGAIGGAAVGGLSGLFNPGQDPETGKDKSRVEAALSRAMGGLATGGLAGGAFGHLAPELSAHFVSQGGNLGRRLIMSASDEAHKRRQLSR